MLLQFTVSNYRSFLTPQTLSMAASAKDRSLPENCIECELPGLTTRYWLKGAAIYGPNASGKSTLLEAMHALRKLVVSSAKNTDPKDPIEIIESFALGNGENEVPTVFEVSLVADDQRFVYTVAATVERVWHESLRAYPTSNPQTWFRRDWEPSEKKYIWGPDRPKGFPRDERLERDTLSNVLYLSKNIASNRTELEPVFRWFKDRFTYLTLDANSILGAGFTGEQLRTQSPLSSRIVQMLQHADLGITDAKMIEDVSFNNKALREVLKGMPEGPLQAEMKKRLESPQLRPQLSHRATGERSVPLPWNVESTGTHRMFALSGIWLNMLADGDVAFIDELETSLHPLLVAELLKLFFDSSENKSRAQLIFTTHNPQLLDSSLLRRDQIWFTDKNPQGQGQLYPLTDYAPRNNESLFRGYLSGRYGAIPFLRHGLMGVRSSLEQFRSEDQPADVTHE